MDEAQQDSRAVRTQTAPVAEAADIPDDILAQDAMMDEVEPPKMRGALADAVAKSAKVEQKLLTPKKSSNGPSRI